MRTLKENLVHWFIIGIFCSLYFLVATISMINSVAFFDLAHDGLMSWSLAIGFEMGAAASLAAIIILDRTNKTMVWALFILLTAFQMMANSYHAFVNLEEYMGWIELFGLEDEEPIFQKRILSIVSGAVLPIVALGFIKSLTDYMKPTKSEGPTEEEIKESYYESRNRRMEEMVAEREAKSKYDAQVQMEDEMHQHIIESIEKEDQQILEDIKEKQEPKVEEKKDDTYKKSDGELKVEVDEETGVTYVKTNRPNTNPI